MKQPEFIEQCIRYAHSERTRENNISAGHALTIGANLVALAAWDAANLGPITKGEVNMIADRTWLNTHK